MLMRIDYIMHSANTSVMLWVHCTTVCHDACMLLLHTTIVAFVNKQSG